MNYITEIGKHKVELGDVMFGLDRLMGKDVADVFYADPPWGSGNLKYWMTMNSKMNDIPKKDIEFDNFMRTFFNMAYRYTRNIVLVEYGVRWYDYLIELAKSVGFIHEGYSTLMYKTGNKELPNHLHLFSKRGVKVPDGYFDSLRGGNGLSNVVNAIRPFAIDDGIVLDPVCGLGLTAKASVKLGMRFRGMEINKKRLDKTIQYLNANS